MKLFIDSENVFFHKKDVNIECPICYEIFHKQYTTVTKCFHIFCKQCLSNWLKINNNCPACRCELINKIPIFSNAMIDMAINNNIIRISRGALGFPVL